MFLVTSPVLSDSLSKLLIAAVSSLNCTFQNKNFCMIYVLFLGRGFFENLSLFIFMYFSLFIFLYRLCPRDCLCSAFSLLLKVNLKTMNYRVK